MTNGQFFVSFDSFSRTLTDCKKRWFSLCGYCANTTACYQERRQVVHAPWVSPEWQDIWILPALCGVTFNFVLLFRCQSDSSEKQKTSGTFWDLGLPFCSSICAVSIVDQNKRVIIPHWLKMQQSLVCQSLIYRLIQDLWGKFLLFVHRTLNLAPDQSTYIYTFAMVQRTQSAMRLSLVVWGGDSPRPSEKKEVKQHRFAPLVALDYLQNRGQLPHVVRVWHLSEKW